MKAKEITKNGNWYLLIKDGRKTIATISKPNELNYNQWNISYPFGVCARYEENELDKFVDSTNKFFLDMYVISLHQITDERNYPADLLICMQDKILDEKTLI